MMTTASVVVMFQLLVLILKRPWALQPRLFEPDDSTHIVGGGRAERSAPPPAARARTPPPKSLQFESFPVS